MKSGKLAIVGAGGLGRELAWMIQEINAQRPVWDVVGFYDDGKAPGSLVDGLPVLGRLPDLNLVADPLSVVIAIADPNTRRRIAGRITNKQLEFPVLIHPSVNTGNLKYNSFGKGSVLAAGVILTTHITIGEFVLINLSTTIGHDVLIGDFSTVMPGCSISGNVRLGECCLMGTGARTLQNIEIGKECVIGAGAVVTKSFKDKARLVGVPASNTQ